MGKHNLSRSISALLHASEDELLAVIGVEAMPVLASPSEILEEGRRGVFADAGEPMAGASRFGNRGLTMWAKKFLRAFAVELRDACCTDDSKYEQSRKQVSDNAEIAVIAILGTLTAALPESLKPHTGLLLALSVFIYQCGAGAFCKLLSDLIEEG